MSTTMAPVRSGLAACEPAARSVARGLGLAVIVTVLASTLMWAIEGFPELPLSFARGATSVGALGLNALAFGIVGAALAAKLPRNPIGWLLLAVAIPLALLTPVNLAVLQTFGVARLIPGPTIAAAWLMSSLLVPLALGLFILVCLLFPDGHLAGRRWRAAAVVTIAGSTLLGLAGALDPSGLVWYPSLPNPAALPAEAAEVVAGLRLGGVGLLVVALGLAVASVTVRYGRADARVRLQLRWVSAAVLVMTAGFLPFLVARYALATSDATGELLMGVAGIAVCSFPVAVAIAVVREHLFDVDAIIGRTLVYVPLMGFLAGLYTASVTLFQRVFVSLTGNSSDAALVLSALILAGMFAPARSALEAQVAKRFRPVPAADAAGGAVAGGRDPDGSLIAGEPSLGLGSLGIRRWPLIAGSAWSRFVQATHGEPSAGLRATVPVEAVGRAPGEPGVVGSPVMTGGRADEPALADRLAVLEHRLAELEGRRAG